MREGRIVTTQGSVTDYRVLKADILRDQARFHPREVPYDPYNATELVNDLMEEGVPMVKFDVNVKNFSPAMKQFERVTRTKRMHHDGNPVMRWMLSNVEVKPDNHQNVFPRKRAGRYENKIDGVMAALSALARAMTVEETGGSYLEHGQLAVADC